MPLRRPSTRGAAALLLGALFLAGCGGGAENGETRKQTKQTRERFVSRPDLGAPAIAVDKAGDDAAPGYIFVSPKNRQGAGGSMILDEAGEVVWYDSLRPRQSADLRVQQYRGKPVLTWWEGTQPVVGIGRGKFVIADESYRPIVELRAANGLDGDLHEFLITPRDTAIVLAYEPVRFDLRRLRGPTNGFVYEAVVQELEIPSGRVLFEWHSLEHVQPRESRLVRQARRANASRPFDYFHVNSVDVDDDGNFLVSGRNTCAVYKISRADGSVMWRLGGKRSDFEMGRGTRFCWQHDARWRGEDTVSIFDNSAVPKVAEQSRAIALRLDEASKRATLVEEYKHPKKLLAPFQGNAQFLENGNVLVGWGSVPYATEFNDDGEIVYDLRITTPTTNSYRAYRFPWVGRPDEPPTAAARLERDGLTVYASWNGATEVASWEVLAGPSAGELDEVATARKEGFETAIDVPDRHDYVAVKALDGGGDTLGTSEPVRPR